MIKRLSTIRRSLNEVFFRERFCTSDPVCVITCHGCQENDLICEGKHFGLSWFVFLWSDSDKTSGCRVAPITRSDLLRQLISLWRILNQCQFQTAGLEARLYYNGKALFSKSRLKLSHISLPLTDSLHLKITVFTEHESWTHISWIWLEANTNWTWQKMMHKPRQRCFIPLFLPLQVPTV